MLQSAPAPHHDFPQGHNCTTSRLHHLRSSAWSVVTAEISEITIWQKTACCHFRLAIISEFTNISDHNRPGTRRRRLGIFLGTFSSCHFL